jgi:putative two-component system hydrogenase maturation factor HypX/HoxX
MAQRTQLLLTEMGHSTTIIVWSTKTKVLHQLEDIAGPKVDIILCPFLTKKIPESVYSDTAVPCVIIHPGIEGDRGISSIDWALRGKATELGVTLLQAVEEMDAGPIWATRTFKIKRAATKSSLYRIECIDAGELFDT